MIFLKNFSRSLTIFFSSSDNYILFVYACSTVIHSGMCELIFTVPTQPLREENRSSPLHFSHKIHFDIILKTNFLRFIQDKIK